MIALISLVLLPLAVIAVQIWLDLDSLLGILGYSLYKVFFLIPPLIYCQSVGISVLDDVLKFRNWKRRLPSAAAIGTLSVVIFWGAYYFLGDLLLDKTIIVGKIGDQFSVTTGTIFLIAPITIFLNSFLEEFFYRAFAFGLLVQHHRIIGYLVPAGAFTVQHLLFIYQLGDTVAICHGSGGIIRVCRRGAKAVRSIGFHRGALGGSRAG